MLMAAPSVGACEEVFVYPYGRTVQPDIETLVAPSASFESTSDAPVAPALQNVLPVAQDVVPTLLLPEVPATLRTPAERADYIVEHFWDALDFTDTLRSRDRGFMEQSFADYVSLFPIADSSSLAPAVSGLVARAQADPEALLLLAEIAGKYLYEQDSPVYNEEYYLLFADAFVDAFADAFAGTSLRDYELLRIEARRTAIRKNRIGTEAADFVFETVAGGRMRLSEAVGAHRRTLLLFYDPECAHCMETVSELSSMEALNEALAGGGMCVVAVYSGMDVMSRVTWRRTLDRLPSTWIAGYDDGTVYTEDLYVLRNMPALYLLDSSGRVMLKDTSPERLAEELRRNFPMRTPLFRTRYLKH